MTTPASYKKSLLDEKEKLETELSHLGKKVGTNDWMATPGAQPGPLGNDDPDENVQADYVEEFESRIAEMNALEKRYQEIVDALARIDKKTFGTCTVCDKPIEDDRLEANPAASTCKAHMK